MKTSERRHLQENDMARAASGAQHWLGEHRTTAIAVIAGLVVVAGGVGGYVTWRGNVANKATAMLAAAMVVEEGRVAPPAPPAGTTNDTTSPGGQLPGTYPTLQVKLETALPKFLAAADAYPTTAAGQTARYHAADTLIELGRVDEAIVQFDKVIGGGQTLIARTARLGKAQAQLRAGQFDPAIATFKELSEQKDGGLPAEGLLMELARAYRMAGKTDDAKKTFTQIVEQHADSPYAAEAKAELEKTKS